MILLDKTPEILSSGNFEATSFSMEEDSSHIIFDILRKKVYKNPKGSICREISCNSRDSHREAGYGERGVEIEISKTSRNIFQQDGLNLIFRDYGVGLSPQRIKDVYSKYGASTKRTTNSQTGGFGLGAKTPFAYTDNFTVRTIVQNMEYIYSVYIDETKKGKIALLFSEENQSENMTEIIIPLQEDDIEIFEREVIRNCNFWDVKPKLINFSSDFQSIPSHSFSDVKIKGCSIYSKSGFIEENVNAIIDGVYYPVDMKILGIDFNYANFALCFEFDNGVLEISANRETLLYDNETIRILKEKVAEAIEEIVRFKMYGIVSLPTFFEAVQAFNNMPSDLENLTNKTKTKWMYSFPDGTTKEIKNDKLKLTTFDIFIVDKDFGSTVEFKKTSITNLYKHHDLNHDLYIINHDNEKKRFSTAINRTCYNKRNSRFIVLIGRKEGSLLDSGLNCDAKEIIEELEELNKVGVKITDYYSLAPTIIKSPTKKRETIVLKTFFNGKFFKDSFRHENGEFVSGSKLYHYYMDSEKSLSGSSLHKRLKDLSSILYLIDDKAKIVISTRLKKRYFKQSIGIEKFLQDNIKEIEKYYYATGYYYQISELKEFAKWDIEKSVKKEIENLLLHKNDKTLGSTVDFKILQEFNIILATQPIVDYTILIYDIYPLLKYVDSRKKEEYIRLVNELNELKTKI